MEPPRITLVCCWFKLIGGDCSQFNSKRPGPSKNCGSHDVVLPRDVAMNQARAMSGFESASDLTPILDHLFNLSHAHHQPARSPPVMCSITRD